MITTIWTVNIDSVTLFSYASQLGAVKALADYLLIRSQLTRHAHTRVHSCDCGTEAENALAEYVPAARWNVVRNILQPYEDPLTEEKMMENVNHARASLGRPNVGEDYVDPAYDAEYDDADWSAEEVEWSD